jgi:hypothetical protein
MSGGAEAGTGPDPPRDIPVTGPGPRRDILFVHVPKTAGTSLRSMLYARPGGRLLLNDYGARSSPPIRALYGPPQRFAALRETVEAPGGFLVYGHFPARRYWASFNADSLITLLRDPVARVVSEWNHHVTRNGRQAGLLDYAEQPDNRNRMARMLGPHWRGFGFVGLTERYEAGLAQLSAHTGIPLEAEKRNAGSYPEGSVRPDRAAPEILARIAGWNAEDAALYAAVQAVWDRHGRWVPEPPAEPPLLRAREVAPGVWRGVCADPGSLRTWMVAARQDGREVARLWADAHSPALKERWGLRTGIGGFLFEAAAHGVGPPPQGGAISFAPVAPG